MNGYSQYNGQQAPNKWAFLQAKNYSDMQSVLSAFPHLKNINPAEPIEKDGKVNGIIIRSANDDNVHKAIKYGIWTTTPKNKSKIQQLWHRKLTQGTNTYLFFSAVKSGMFEGVARLNSGYHEQTFPFWWQNHTLKFKGYFQLEWVYIKDVNNKHFNGLYNTEEEEVIKSKDCDTLDSATTLKMLQIFHKKKSKRNIFMDFAYMDQRESQYIRKMYQVTAYYNQYNMMGYRQGGYDLSQLNLVGNPLAMMTPQPPQQQAGMGQPMSQMGPMGQMNPIGMPPAMMKPNNNQNPGSNLGFQMNPVSKNSKKK